MLVVVMEEVDIEVDMGLQVQLPLSTILLLTSSLALLRYSRHMLRRRVLHAIRFRSSAAAGSASSSISSCNYSGAILSEHSARLNGHVETEGACSRTEFPFWGFRKFPHRGSVGVHVADGNPGGFPLD